MGELVQNNQQAGIEGCCLTLARILPRFLASVQSLGEHLSLALFVVVVVVVWVLQADTLGASLNLVPP